MNTNNCPHCGKGPVQKTDEVPNQFCCALCKSIFLRYDSEKIFRARSKNGSKSARMFVYEKTSGDGNRHSLLQLFIPELTEFAYKTADEAITSGKEKLKAHFGEDLILEQVQPENPTDDMAKSQLLAGIKKTV